MTKRRFPPDPSCSYAAYLRIGRPGTESNNVERGHRGSGKGKRIRHYKKGVVHLRRHAKRVTCHKRRKLAAKIISEQMESM